MSYEAVKVNRLKKIAKPLISIVMLLALLMIPALCYADESAKFYGGDLNNKSIMGNTEVMVGGSHYTPNLSDYGDYTQIGLDLLYDVDAKQTVYYGEVPRYATKEIADKEGYKWVFENKRFFGSSNIAGSGHRSYAWNVPSGQQGIFYYIDSYKTTSDEGDEFADLHLYGLTQSDLWAGNILRALGNLIPLVIGAIYAICSTILGFMIWVCNFDPGTVATAFGFSRLQESVTRLVIGENGTPSPLLVIAAIIFIIGLVVLMVKRLVTGDAPMRAILTELLYLILAATLAAACVTGNIAGLQITIQKLGEEFVTAVAQGTNTGSTNSNKDPMWLYGYESGNSNEDLIKTQTALSKKPYVDLIIFSQFGYEVDDLEISDEQWGNCKVEEIMSSLSTDSFDLSVSNTTGSGKVLNLGYFWYCADSGVNPNEPLTKSGDTLKLNMGSPDNTVYVIDFLAAIDANTADSATHAKAQSIVQKFNDPSIDSGRLFLVTIIQLVTAMTAGAIAIFTVIAKLIFFLGLALLPVFPILLLIPATRTKCKDLLMVWLVSAVKMIVGMMVLTLVLEFSAILCGKGMVGTLVDLVFMIGMFVFVPKLFSNLNNLFAEYDKRFPATRWANNATGRLFNRIDDNRGGRFNRIYESIRQQRAEAGAAPVHIEDDEQVTKDRVEAAYSNIEAQTSDFLNGGSSGSGFGDEYLSDDAEYQRKKAGYELKYAEEADLNKVEIIDKQRDMEDKFDKLSKEDQINEIYNYQRLSRLQERGDTASKEYQDIKRAQIAMEKGIKEKEVTAEDMKNFKLDNDKAQFYNSMDTMTTKDRKDALKALKKDTNMKSVLKSNVDENISDMQKSIEEHVPGGKTVVKIGKAANKVGKAVVQGSAVVNAGKSMKQAVTRSGVVGKMSEKDRVDIEHGKSVLDRFTSNKAKVERAEKTADRYKKKMSKAQEEYRKSINIAKLDSLEQEDE